ncbi:MAG: tryptophan synthase subunit alpha [Acutalibacteraceae bacterium]|nr:tryptophan synthase subunit alpha [Clostridiales bacterium]
MNRINKAFLNKKAFIPFITAGDPNLETTEKLIIAMQESGADLIEIGIPFSDPIAEGEVIQNASQRALSAGCDTDKIFDMVSRVRQCVTVPLVFMTYINLVYTYGKERFLKKCKDVGIDGIIIPDLPFEENKELIDVCKKYDVNLISLIAPTSKERVEMIAKQANGFVYCVSSLGVTGVRENIKTDIGQMIKLVKTVSKIPCAVGFGISTPNQAKKISEVCDGVIVGSAIVKIIEKYGENSIEPVKEYVKLMKKAMEQG